MVTESTGEILIVIYAPSAAPDAALEEAMAQLCARLSQFGGARATRAGICR
jgi:DNA/RNA-binding domain of Phe-tRNA-synthetase-like protein